MAPKDIVDPKALNGELVTAVSCCFWPSGRLLTEVKLCVPKVDVPNVNGLTSAEVEAGKAAFSAAALKENVGADAGVEVDEAPNGFAAVLDPKPNPEVAFVDPNAPLPLPKPNPVLAGCGVLLNAPKPTAAPLVPDCLTCGGAGADPNPNPPKFKLLEPSPFA